MSKCLSRNCNKNKGKFVAPAVQEKEVNPYYEIFYKLLKDINIEKMTEKGDIMKQNDFENSWEMENKYKPQIKKIDKDLLMKNKPIIEDLYKKVSNFSHDKKYKTRFARYQGLIHLVLALLKIEVKEKVILKNDDEIRDYVWNNLYRNNDFAQDHRGFWISWFSNQYPQVSKITNRKGDTSKYASNLEEAMSNSI